MKLFNEDELVLLHDAMCFAHINNKRFKSFLKERKNPVNILKTWESGEHSYGHDLIGKVYDYNGSTEQEEE